MTIASDRPNPVDHITSVDLHGKIIDRPCLTSFDLNNIPKRDTVLLDFPIPGVALPREIEEKMRLFETTMTAKRKSWGFNHRLPSLLRFDRLRREGELSLSEIGSDEIITVAHHSGCLPALKVGGSGRYNIAMLPRTLRDHNTRPTYSHSELLEVLRSYEASLRISHESAFEQAANYLKAIFFSGSDEYVASYCLRVRELIGRYIAEKHRILKHARADSEETRALARMISERNADVIRVAQTFDSLAHLIVNYVYRFYCVADWVDRYQGEMDRTRGSSELKDPDPVLFMQQCAARMKDPNARFPNIAVERQSQSNQPAWLFDVGEVCDFVAEVRKFIDNRAVDRPYIYLSYRSRVFHSEQFRETMEQRFSDPSAKVGILTSRTLQDDLRSNLLAGIWFCDHQLAFAPCDWTDEDGVPRRLRIERDWVMIELLYGRLIKRPCTFVVCAPKATAKVDYLRKRIPKYTADCEIPQVNETLWRSTVGESKQELVTLLQDRAYLQYSLMDPEPFFLQFEDFVRIPATLRYLRMLFKVWALWYQPTTWSVAQAILDIWSTEQRSPSVQETVERVLSLDAEDKYAWLLEIEAHKRAGEVNDMIDRLCSGVDSFSFRFDGQPRRPLVLRPDPSVGGRIHVDAKSIFDDLAEKFSVPKEELPSAWEGLLRELKSAR